MVASVENRCEARVYAQPPFCLAISGSNPPQSDMPHLPRLSIEPINGSCFSLCGLWRKLRQRSQRILTSCLWASS